MKDQIALITGANSGIGKAATLKFATGGYTVIMACRNVTNSRQVQEEIIETSNNQKVDLMELDVSSVESIRQFCENYKKKYEKLDILIHNAAYVNHGAKYSVSVDQIELTHATNVIGPYLMTSLLVDHLKKSNDARILHAGSNIIKHFFDPKKKIERDNLQGEDNDPKFTVYKMYCQSKMALMMLTFKMAKEFANEGIKVNALQINGAKMSKETINKMTLRYRIVAKLQNIFFPPTSYMATNYFEICTSERYKDITGKIFNDELEIMTPSSSGRVGPVASIKQAVGKTVYPIYAHDPNMTETVWKLCEKLTGSQEKRNV